MRLRRCHGYKKRKKRLYRFEETRQQQRKEVKLEAGETGKRLGDLCCEEGQWRERLKANDHALARGDVPAREDDRSDRTGQARQMQVRD